MNRATHFFLSFLVLFLLGFSSGCTKRDSRTGIEFWTLQLSPTFNGYFQNLIAEYERQHPDRTVRWVDVPYDAAVQKLLASVAAGNAPDVVNLSSDFLAKFSSMNAFLDFSTLVPPDSLSIFLPNAMETCVYGKKIIALPWYLNTYVLIYNKRFLNEAGFSEKDVPVNFAGLAEFVKKYKDRTGKFALFWNIGKDSYLPTLLESEGVAMTDDSVTKATFNSPRGIALISEWVDLYRKGYLQGESIINRGTTVIEAYQSGQVAMVFTGPVFLRRVKENAPSVYGQTDVSRNPVGATGKQELATMVISLLSTSQHPKEAADFSMFLLNARNQLEFSKIETTYPSVTSALKDSFFTINDGTLETKARILGAKELSFAMQLSAYKHHPSYIRLHDAFDEAIQNACLGKSSTKEALDAAALQWNEIFSGRTQ